MYNINNTLSVTTFFHFCYSASHIYTLTIYLQNYNVEPLNNLIQICDTGHCKIFLLKVKQKLI